MKTTRRLIFAAIPAFTLAAINVFADSYPDRRITMVIPFPAAGRWRRRSVRASGSR